MSDKTLDEGFKKLSSKVKPLIKKLKEKQKLEGKEKLLLSILLEKFPIETYKFALEEGFDLLSDDAKDEIIENLKPEDPEIFLEDLEIKINGLSLYCARCGYELKLEGTGRIPKPDDCPKECPNCERKTTWCRDVENPIDFWKERKEREEEKKNREKIAEFIKLYNEGRLSTKELLQRLEKLPIKKEEALKIDEEELERLNKNPLLHILNALESHHVGGETERKSILTGFVYALNCIATGGGILKITGNSSAGKTNAAKTILSCFPDEWIKDVGDISPAALKYIIWKEEKILYIREAGDDERTTQHLKFMDIGDGGFKALVTQGSPSTGFETVEIDIPVKFILTTRAEGLFDLQLENRMFEISIDESEQQTFNVTYFKALRDAGYWKPISFDTIRHFIRNLETFDEIRVPFSFVFLKLFDMKKVKTRRDYDKLIMLCKASAFLNQKNRPKKVENGRRILYATPEDAYYVMLLAMESFQETTTGLSKKLKAIYDILDENGKTFSQITKELGGPSKKTVQRHCEQLDRLGYADVDTSKKPYLVKKAREIKIEEQRFENYKDAILLFSLATLVDQLGHVELPLSWIDFGEVIGRDSLWDIVRQKKTLKDVAWDKWWDNNGTKMKDFYTKESISKLFEGQDNIVLSHPVSGDVPLFVSQLIRREDNKLYISVERRDTETKSTQTCIDLFDFLCKTCPGVSPTQRLNNLDPLTKLFFVLATKHRHEFTVEELAQETELSEDEVRKHLYNLPIIKPHENTFAINPEGKVTVLMKEDIGPVVDPNNPSRVINATKNDVLTVPIQIALNGLRQGKMEIIKKTESRNEGLNSSQNLSPEFVLQDQKGRSDDSEAKGKEC